MTEETLLKYLEFLKTEYLRHQNDKFITDDEVNLLEIETKRFTGKAEKTSFTSEIKQEISKIDFNLDEENHHKQKYKWLNFIAGFKSKEMKQQENRTQRFLKLYSDLDTALFKIKSHL